MDIEYIDVNYKQSAVQCVEPEEEQMGLKVDVCRESIGQLHTGAIMEGIFRYQLEIILNAQPVSLCLHVIETRTHCRERRPYQRCVLFGLGQPEEGIERGLWSVFVSASRPSKP
jgi:hypothetical protein